MFTGHNLIKPHATVTEQALLRSLLEAVVLLVFNISIDFVQYAMVHTVALA
jgi:hypothetical protein